MTSSRARKNKWMREPLLHFILIGAVLFALDYFIAGQADDPHTIVVGSAVDAEAKQTFQTARGRLPNDDELKALRQVWLDNEVLYREGLALGLDKGDIAIRERVIFKALSMVDANTKRPDVDEKVLREWFEKNRARYDQPARYNFQEAVISGDSSEATVRSFVSALNSGTAPDVEAGLRVFTDRPRGNLVQSYGTEFTAALETSPPAEWRAIQSKDGWRAIRVESSTPAQPAEFDKILNVVLQDWTDAVMAEQRSAAVSALAKKYTIKHDTEATQ
ncbi:MAG: peptidylprolyl isomerase [Steroidobacter sp.]